MNKYIFIFLIALVIVSCSKKNKVISYETKSCENVLTKTKMNGVSFVAISSPVDSSHFTPVKKLNATWITAMPFGFIPSGSSTVTYNSNWQWIGEKKEGIINTIKLAHEKGLKVMVKPHIWITNIWVGAMDYSTETEWENFEKSYAKYILDFARVSDSMQVESFCIGVELKKSVVKRPIFWKSLIDSVRLVYSGKITYAANWDNYKKVTFWNKLDYIGIDAYFPVSDKKTPSFDDCYKGWSKNYNEIKNLSNSVNKKIVFTEYGYRNIDFTGKEPWNEHGNSTFNSEAQENAYRAVFCRFWKEPWFEGAFLWKWFPNHSNAGGKANNRFTPQNKPVEDIIRNTFLETNY